MSELSLPGCYWILSTVLHKRSCRRPFRVRVGFLCALEQQGYEGSPYARQTTLLTDWSVEKALRLGASGIKLLIFYHPDAGAATVRGDELVVSVVEDCKKYDIPLFLEPLGYPLDPAIKVDSAEYAQGRPHITIETAKRLGALGPDVLKLQFPVDARHEPSEAVWRQTAEELAAACQTPWVLLSFGDPFDVFKAQLEVACRAGCSGFMAGRSVWREVITAAQSERTQVIEEVVPAEVSGIMRCRGTARQTVVCRSGASFR